MKKEYTVIYHYSESAPNFQEKLLLILKNALREREPLCPIKR
jgi:hypothetical protein